MSEHVTREDASTEGSYNERQEQWHKDEVL